MIRGEAGKEIEERKKTEGNNGKRKRGKGVDKKREE